MSANDIVTSLGTAISTLATAQQEIVAFGGELESAQRTASAATQDVGRAAINMRDYIYSHISQWVPNMPVWVIQRIASLHFEQDDQGNFTRDAANNFNVTYTV
jgi:phosphatidate phosphatase APP1